MKYEVLQFQYHVQYQTKIPIYITEQVKFPKVFLSHWGFHTEVFIRLEHTYGQVFRVLQVD